MWSTTVWCKHKTKWWQLQQFCTLCAELLSAFSQLVDDHTLANICRILSKNQEVFLLSWKLDTAGIESLSPFCTIRIKLMSAFSQLQQTTILWQTFVRYCSIILRVFFHTICIKKPSQVKTIPSFIALSCFCHSENKLCSLEQKKELKNSGQVQSKETI